MKKILLMAFALMGSSLSFGMDNQPDDAAEYKSPALSGEEDEIDRPDSPEGRWSESIQNIISANKGEGTFMGMLGARDSSGTSRSSSSSSISEKDATPQEGISSTSEETTTMTPEQPEIFEKRIEGMILKALESFKSTLHTHPIASDVRVRQIVSRLITQYVPKFIDEIRTAIHSDPETRKNMALMVQQTKELYTLLPEMTAMFKEAFGYPELEARIARLEIENARNTESIKKYLAVTQQQSQK